jgi:hypothetical protein
LLREVQTGQLFENSVQGHIVARLGSMNSPQQKRSDAMRKMREFMQAQADLQAGSGLVLRELIDPAR